MNIHTADNHLYLSGTAMTGVEYSHSVKGRDYFTVKLAVTRLSGHDDVLTVILPGETPGIESIKKDGRFAVSGETRSHNNRTGEGSRLLIFAYAREIQICAAPQDTNLIRLAGAACKEPVYRKTPLGREICDLLMVVKRKYGRADYLPVILWGKNARAAAAFSPGDRLAIEGRLQSRDYIKEIGDTSMVKTAIEISASEMEIR